MSENVMTQWRFGIAALVFSCAACSAPGTTTSADADALGKHRKDAGTALDASATDASATDVASSDSSSFDAAVDPQPTFPIRAAFYYPWFPEAWTQLSIYPYTNYHPSLGYYDSSSTSVIATHIAAMQYAKIDAAISSWWGQGTKTDSRVPALLAGASGTSFRFALYYEQEGQGDPTVSQISSDLSYIAAHYGSDPSFLRVGGRFVVFVYADPNDACGMADRWKQANTAGAYVVLKVFAGYTQCASQPDGWHQYDPAVDQDQQGSYSFTISPGFWKVGEQPRLARDVTRFKTDVQAMVASGARFQLVTTFSEWGEGTAVESATEWATSSGYGEYLDALHTDGL